MLSDKLERNSTTVKSTLEAMGSLDEKYRQVSVEADEAKNKVATLEAVLQTKQNWSSKDRGGSGDRKEDSN